MATLFPISPLHDAKTLTHIYLISVSINRMLISQLKLFLGVKFMLSHRFNVTATSHSQPITGSQPLWRHSCYVQRCWKSHLPIMVVHIEFAWNYAAFNSNYYHFMRLTQLWKFPNYANKSLNYSSVGDSWIPVWVEH